MAEDAEGWIVAMTRTGEGRFIALAEPALLTNGGLEEADNAEFMVHLAMLASRGRPVVFDEFHHGFMERGSPLAILADSPLGVAVVLALAACFCGVFAANRRLGPPVDLHEERRRKPTEHVDACARLCASLGAGPQALSMILSEFEGEVRRLDGELEHGGAERLDARAGLPPGTVARVVEHARMIARDPGASDALLVASCHELEDLRARLAARVGSPRRMR